MGLHTINLKYILLRIRLVSVEKLFDSQWHERRTNLMLNFSNDKGKKPFQTSSGNRNLHRHSSDRTRHCYHLRTGEDEDGEPKTKTQTKAIDSKQHRSRN